MSRFHSIVDSRPDKSVVVPAIAASSLFLKLPGKTFFPEEIGDAHYEYHHELR